MNLLGVLLIKHTGRSFTLLVSNMFTGYLSHSRPGHARAHRDTEVALGVTLLRLLRKSQGEPAVWCWGRPRASSPHLLFITPSGYPTKRLFTSLICMMRPQVRYWGARTRRGDTPLKQQPDDQGSGLSVCLSVSWNG